MRRLATGAILLTGLFAAFDVPVSAQVLSFGEPFIVDKTNAHGPPDKGEHRSREIESQNPSAQQLRAAGGQEEKTNVQEEGGVAADDKSSR
jgi:hypothetical protein